MIRFAGIDERGLPVIGLGLTRENIDRLTDGQPIRVTGDTVNMPALGAVLVFFGESHADLYEALRSIGAVDEHTIQHRDGRAR